MNDTSKSTVSLSSPRGPILSIPASSAFIEFKLEETEQSIGERFEKIVVQYSKQLAVKDRSCELTYGELNKLANRVAHSILSQYKESGQPVALLLGHRAQTIAAILGVLKSGNLYVPLDPAVPDSRNSYFLNGSKCSVVITNTENLSLAKQLVGDSRQLINIDCIDRAVADDNVRQRISPDDLAYVLYTSGSTGQPKGVAQNHRNVLRVVRRYTNAHKISSQDRLTHFATFSVTASVANMLSAILNGAALFLFEVKEEGVAKLADWLIKNDITFYHSVASVFRNFAITLTGAEQLPKLRLIRLGGDRVYRSDVELYKKHFPDHCFLVNCYGASELSSLTQYCIDKNTAVIDDDVPVGWPVDETTFYLIDEDGKRVGFNVTGEIVIQGRALSPGYWQRPEMTHAVFQSDPQDGDGRTYHTGDMGYLLPNGCLVSRGRKDFQTKIRGFKVEPDDIGRVLCSLPTIKEAVVVARKDRFGENQLVAYVVPHSGYTLESSDLRHFVTGQLATYMVPSFFVFLEALPLTRSGKVDRKELPELNNTELATEKSFVPASTPVEEVVARIWSEVLAIKEIGIYNNFFECGGNSLSATRVVSRLRDTFRIEVSLRSVLEAPTVAGLVARILQDAAKRTKVEKIAELLISTTQLSDSDAKTMLNRKLDDRARSRGHR